MISSCPFNLAIENSFYPGYITEKLVDPYLVGVIPIYLGAPDVSTDFNIDSFIDISKYESIEELTARIENVFSSEKLFLDIINSPLIKKDILHYKDNYFNHDYKVEFINKFLHQ